jgi:hypothetical protein
VSKSRGLRPTSCYSRVRRAAPRPLVDNVSIAEGNSGLNLAAFTLRLSIPSTALRPVYVQSQDVTATANSDYLPVNSEIAFQPAKP